MTEHFFGIDENEVPGFVGLGEQYVSFDELPDSTKGYIHVLLQFLRERHEENPLAFEATITFLATYINAENESTIH